VKPGTLILHSRVDVVVHRGVAHWVEVAEDMSLDARVQIAQVLAQIDATLETIRSDRMRLLQVLVYIATEADGAILNELWDAWVPAGHPPVRAMVQVSLGKSCKVEMVVTAAVRRCEQYGSGSIRSTTTPRRYVMRRSGHAERSAGFGRIASRCRRGVAETRQVRAEAAASGGHASEHVHLPVPEMGSRATRKPML